MPRGENENSRKNLKPWKKGESGNPNGRPQGSLNAKSTLEHWLGVKVVTVNPITKEKITAMVLDEVTLALIAQARSGNIQAIKEIFDRLDGKSITRLGDAQGDNLPITGMRVEVIHSSAEVAEKQAGSE